jgi:uncharacterized protein (DUF1330 family)
MVTNFGISSFLDQNNVPSLRGQQRRSARFGPRQRADVMLAGSAIGAAAVQDLHAAGSAPAYVVTEIGISDVDAYQKEYLPLAQASIKGSDGRLVAGGQNIVVYEGPSPGMRVAINAFDSLNAAQAWRKSDQFNEARKVGDKCAKFRSFAIEGFLR